MDQILTHVKKGNPSSKVRNAIDNNVITGDINELEIITLINFTYMFLLLRLSSFSCLMT